MIVHAAITPHPPLVIPTIGGDNARFVKTTSESLHKIAQSIAQAKPDCIIIISPHGATPTDSFTINQSPQYTADFKDFGDLETRYGLKGDVAHSHHYKEILEGAWPIVLQTQVELDHGIGVPVHFLAQVFSGKLPKVVPMYPSELDASQHYGFGHALHDDLMNDTARIAIIASADLSHRLSPDSPAGLSHWAAKFDETVRTCVANNDIQKITSLDHDFIEDAGECGLRPIVMLLGMLDGIRYTPTVLSYEAPLGVGYMAAQYTINA